MVLLTCKWFIISVYKLVFYESKVFFLFFDNSKGKIFLVHYINLILYLY